MGFLNTAKIRAVDILQQTYDYMSKKYGLSSAVFTPSSPSGMILGTLANIAELIFVYLEHVASELNMMRAQTPASVYGLSRLTGHDPFRGSAARGLMTIKINPSSTDYNGYVKILNGTQFVLGENGLQYFLNLDSDYIILTLDGEPQTVEYIQGIKTSQTFTASGENLQTYNVNEKSITDHEMVEVYVNGEKWRKVESIYDMPYNGKCFMCKSSINMGLTIYFGNEDFGRVPESGSTIVVTYVAHAGVNGNLVSNNPTYNFTMSATDIDGESVDINKVLSIQTDQSPMMGSNYETLNMTRLLAPHTSKSFVLATPENYITFLSRYSQFSFINAYNTKDDKYIDDDNVVYLQVLPDVKNRLGGGEDYFTLPADKFVLSENEKNAIRTTLDNSGRQLISTEVVIKDMVVRKYALFVMLKYFANIDKNVVRATVRERLNDYFLNINRSDILPKSDIVSIVESIEGVDSVNVYFVSERNERAVMDGYYMVEEDWINPMTHLHETTTRRVVLGEGQEPLLGLDAFGDIKIEPNEIAVIKGGWNDRYGNEYKEEIDPNALSGLNIVFVSATDPSLYNMTQQNALNKILQSKYNN